MRSGMSVQMRFGDWRLDPDARQLFGGSEAVHVSPKAFDLLTLLVERRPRALSKAGSDPIGSGCPYPTAKAGVAR